MLPALLMLRMLQKLNRLNTLPALNKLARDHTEKPLLAGWSRVTNAESGDLSPTGRAFVGFIVCILLPLPS
jgi:hypothetical protein